MADAVGALNVKDCQVGGLFLQPGRRQIVIDTRLDQCSAKRADRIAVRILGLERAFVVRRRQPGQETLQCAVIDCRLGLLNDCARPRLVLARCDHTFGRLRFLEQKREQAIRDHQAVDGFGGIRRPHPEHSHRPPSPARHVPNRRHAPLVAGDGFFRLRSRLVAREVQDTVHQRIDAGHHAGPDERRQCRVQRLECARRSFGDEPRQVGHVPISNVAVEELPVGAVESQEDHRWSLAAVLCNRWDRSDQ